MKKVSFQHDGHYVCVCGREFTKSQSYNAHLSHCKEHLGEEKYARRIMQQKESFQLANEVRSNKCKEIKEEKTQLKQLEWESTLHYCEKCGKLLPNNFKNVFGSGRFCSVECANSHVVTDDIKNKISKGVKITFSLTGNCGNSKGAGRSGWFDGLFIRSSYELVYYVWNKFNKIDITAPPEHFKYLKHDNDTEWSNYFPDFYLPETNEIVECKGSHQYYDRDICKRKKQSVLDTGRYNYLFLIDEDFNPLWDDIVNKFITNKNLKEYTDLCDLLYRDTKENCIMFDDLVTTMC